MQNRTEVPRSFQLFLEKYRIVNLKVIDKTLIDNGGDNDGDNDNNNDTHTHICITPSSLSVNILASSCCRLSDGSLQMGDCLLQLVVVSVKLGDNHILLLDYSLQQFNLVFGLVVPLLFGCHNSVNWKGLHATNR